MIAFEGLTLLLEAKRKQFSLFYSLLAFSTNPFCSGFKSGEYWSQDIERWKNRIAQDKNLIRFNFFFVGCCSRYMNRCSFDTISSRDNWLNFRYCFHLILSFPIYFELFSCFKIQETTQLSKRFGVLFSSFFHCGWEIDGEYSIYIIFVLAIFHSLILMLYTF